jgi:hypothetical protein
LTKELKDGSEGIRSAAEGGTLMPLWGFVIRSESVWRLKTFHKVALASDHAAECAEYNILSANKKTGYTYVDW